MKRFYGQVAVEAANGAGFQVTLDRRPVRTPAAAAVLLSSRALAEALAEEWRHQEQEVVPATMPLMRLTGTAIDRVAPHRAAAIDEVAGFAATDLVCHRAEAPPTLVARQDRTWQPLVDWAAGRYQARLQVATGVMPRQQPARTLAALRDAVAVRDDLALAGLWSLTAACGSLVIALALAERRLDPDAAVAAAQLDEDFQIERWGEAPAAARHRAAIRAEIEAADRFLRLLETPAAGE